MVTRERGRLRQVLARHVAEAELSREDALGEELAAVFTLTELDELAIHDQRDAVVKRVNIGDEVEMIVAQLGVEAREDLMKTLAEAAAVDGHVAEREIDVIKRIGVVLSIQAAHPGLLPRDA